MCNTASLIKKWTNDLSQVTEAQRELMKTSGYILGMAISDSNIVEGFPDRSEVTGTRGSGISAGQV